MVLSMCPAPKSSCSGYLECWKEDLSCFPIYLFLNHLFIPGHTDSLFSLGHNLIFSLFTLLLNWFQFLVAGSVSRLDLDTLSKGPQLVVFSSPLRVLFKISDTIRCPWLILYFPCPCPRTSHVSGELWFPCFWKSHLETTTWSWICLLPPGCHC